MYIFLDEVDAKCGEMIEKHNIDLFMHDQGIHYFSSHHIHHLIASIQNTMRNNSDIILVYLTITFGLSEIMEIIRVFLTIRPKITISCSYGAAHNSDIFKEPGTKRLEHQC